MTASRLAVKRPSGVEITGRPESMLETAAVVGMPGPKMRGLIADGRRPSTDSMFWPALAVAALVGTGGCVEAPDGTLAVLASE